jgi:hypothetical protein
MNAQQHAEARHLVAELEFVFESLPLQDQRFVAGWRAYLTRTGDQAQIGSRRLELLRRIHKAARARAVRRSAQNPWSAEDWNLTEQMQYVRKYGLEKAGQLAQAAGVALGELQPQEQN